MCSTGTLVILSIFVVSAVLPMAQKENVLSVSIVLSTCQNIATNTAKILQQQRQEYVTLYWQKAANIATYVSIWSERVKSQGANPQEVNRCSAKFNQSVYSNREAMNDDLVKKAALHMTRFDAEMFEILTRNLKPDSLKKYVGIIKGISETELNTHKNEVETLFKSTVTSLKTSYQTTGNCLRNLMISADAMKN